MQSIGPSRALAVASAVSAFSSGLTFGQATFTVDPSASIINVGGTALELPINPQGPGSLTTSYFGSVLANLTPSTISFPGGSSVIANNSGNWQPLPGGASGSAPANYGGQITVIILTGYAAVRDAAFDVSTTAPLSLSAGQFSSAVDFTATAGNVDFNAPIVGSGTQPVAGNTATNDSPNPGTLNIAPGTGGSANATLGLPVNFTLILEFPTVGTGEFTFTGSATARATAEPGDANFDGNVNLIDYNVLAGNFGTSSGANWLAGDFNFDGRVNLNDYNILSGNFGAAAAPSIPEPAAIAAIVMVAPLALRRRRESKC